MDSCKRIELIQRLMNDTRFSQLARNYDRVKYVFEHVTSYQQFSHIAKRSIRIAAKTSRKNGTIATRYMAESEQLAREARRSNDHDKWDRALKAIAMVSDNCSVTWH